VTLISSIILDAYRESNIIPLAAVPNDNQTTEALRLYNAILSSLFGTDVGENLIDYPLGNFGRDPEAHYPPITTTDPCFHQPPINTRLIAVNDAAISMDLSVHPQDGARYGILDPYGRLAAFPVTLNGNGRTIGGAASITLNTNGAALEWVYRADKGDWVQLSSKLATDENPFPAEFDAMFTVLLALRLNPRYGRALTDLSQSILKQGRTMFVARYLNSQPLLADDSISWPFMSRMGYGYGRQFSSTNGFSRGSIYG